MRGVPQDRIERRRDALALGLLVLLVSSFYFDVLFLGNNFFTRDLTHYHYPMKKVVRDTVLDGQLPLWNPMYGGGQPMAANPAYEVFYPPQWLTLIPDYNLGFRLHIVLHVWLAAIGAFLFLRSRGVGREVSFLGSAAFVLGGPFVSVFNLLPFMFSVAWTPWIALFAARYFDSRSRRDVSLLVLALGMQAIICEPTTLLQTWFLLGLWGAWHGWARGGAAPRAVAAARGFVSAVLAVVAGLVLSAVQFLPALDHAADSVRRDGFRWETVSQWSFPPLRLVEMVYPSFLGPLETGGPLYWGYSLYPNVGGPYFYSVYIGLPFVALLLAGIATRRRGYGFVLATLVVSVVLAMGSWTPVLRLLFDAGMLPSIRYPEKFILMGAFVALAWACMVLDDLIRGSRSAVRATAFVLVLSSVVAGGLFAWGFFAGYEEWFRSFWPESGPQAAYMSRVHWMLAVGRGLAFAAAIEIARRTRIRAAFALLVLLLVADLGPLGNQVNPRMPRRYFDAPPAMAGVGETAAGSRLLHLAWLDRDRALLGRISGGHDAYWDLRNGLIPSLPAVWSVPTILEWDVDETHLLHTRELLSYSLAYMRDESAPDPAWREDAVRQIAGMCNVGVVATIREGLDRRIGWSDREASQPVVFDEVRGGPRYYFASEAVAVRGGREMFEKLVSREWPRAVAFVEGGGAPVSWGVVHEARERPGRIELDVEALGEATLVASVTRHKYWRATVDGAPVPIRTVNLAFQGVTVPPGRHTVALRYWNPLVPAGGAVSLVMAAGLLIGIRKGRRR